MPVRELLAVPVLALLTTSALAATYYASPRGGGDGRSGGSPFLIADFWPVAKPGDTLLLLDGRYRGERSMINPPQGLHGSEGDPITVRALNDGGAEIDAESSGLPVKLSGNDYFVLEGLNAHSADGGRNNATVVLVSRSNHCIVRRVCAWDAQDGNTNIFAAHYGEHNLFEDCAGWGIARKTYSNSQGGNYTTYRRCWGRWEGCHVIGPKMTFTLFYNSHSILVENCIATWDGLRMAETYVLPASKTPGSERYAKPRTMENHAVDQPYGLFSADNYRRDMPTTGPFLYGCIAYALSGQRLVNLRGAYALGWGNNRDDGYIENCLAYWDPRIEETSGGTFDLFAFRGRNLTAVGPEARLRENAEIDALVHSPDGRDIVARHGHLLASPEGATILYRYENGTLTDEPLWPWPMNQRIIDAMRLAGYEDAVDVTKTVFELGGGRVPDFDRLYRKRPGG